MSQLDHSPGQDPVEEEAGFLDLLIVLAKHKLLIVGLPVLAALVSAAISLQLPNIYTATTKILPPQQTPASAAMLAQLGSLAGLVGGTATGGIKNPNDLYVGMLKSRTVADNLIQRFDLNKVYERNYQSETRRRLASETTIVAGRDGIITVDVDDKDPKRAAALANGYVEELFKLTQVLAVTEASQRRLFFERQLDRARENLATAEAAARQALEAGGLVMVENQGRVMAETIARLRAEITVKEVQIGAMRAFATGENPELQRTQQEVEVMKRELARLEGTSGIKPIKPKDTDGQGIDNLGLLREMKYHEATYELLAKQLEIAKIDEAKDSAVIQVLDRAVEPDRKSKPVRRQIVLLTILVTALFAVVCIFFLEAMARTKRDPRSAERWHAFMQHVRLRAWWPNKRA